MNPQMHLQSSQVIPSWLANKMKPIKKGWERWPVPLQLPSEAALEIMDVGKEVKRLTGLQLSFIKRHQAMLTIFMARLSAKHSSKVTKLTSTYIKQKTCSVLAESMEGSHQQMHRKQHFAQKTDKIHAISVGKMSVQSSTHFSLQQQS
jgi:hypothetical protein